MATSLKDDLRTQGFSLRETHASWVFLGDTRVFKVKKAVNLGFLDFSTIDLRKAACQAELDLNRRLAPDVYCGLVPVRRDPQGRHHLGDEGPIVDWAVEMVRLADEDSAEAMLKRGALQPAHVREVAHRLAHFHSRCRCDEETSRFGSVEMIEHNLQENFEQTRASGPAHLDPAQIEVITDFQLGFLHRHRALFERRVAKARVRDGHGDLRLEHLYFTPDGLQIIDCIEFNDRFRYGDVCADIAFLCMDLAYNSQVELAELFVAYYAEQTDDYDIYRLMDFYVSYRAYVRAKVTAMLETQPGQSEEVRARLHRAARKYFLLSEAGAKPPLQTPLMIVVFGKIAAGKSTVAQRLGQALTAPVLNSDRVRKSLAGVSPTASLKDAPYGGAYGADMTARVYDALCERADAVLTSLRPVIVDATCSRAQQRERFRSLAETHSVPLLMVECHVPDDVTRARLRERAQGPSVSDADLDLLDAFMANYEPPTELPDGLRVTVDTTRIDNALVQHILGQHALATPGQMR